MNWDFLRYIIKRMGFGSRWMNWMGACIFPSQMSVLVNGNPIVNFEVGMGLWKGDPLSPFLFVIIVEGLTYLVKKTL